MFDGLCGHCVTSSFRSVNKFLLSDFAISALCRLHNEDKLRGFVPIFAQCMIFQLILYYLFSLFNFHRYLANSVLWFYDSSFIWEWKFMTIVDSWFKVSDGRSDILHFLFFRCYYRIVNGLAIYRIYKPKNCTD